MPELPEVETTRRGIAPAVIDQRVDAVDLRQPSLRWPVDPALVRELPGRRITSVTRRAKYLLFAAGDRHLMIHLGMSGRLRLVPEHLPVMPHDHLDIRLSSGLLMRYHDPRRFGSAHWFAGPVEQHPLIRHLGPEPLGEEFDGDHLYRLSRTRSVAAKLFIMNSQVVVGVGNIYASEALHQAGIHPLRAAGRISRLRYQALAEAIRQVLARAIEAGGTTLRDYVGVDGGQGWFQLELAVYGRAGRPCPRGCGPIRQRRIGQRASFFCPVCQR
ncbi:MAG: DNA-formamidopyrimidine glycosylase [Salinisphaeraceae bacterium]|nr:DNA-formamidopyrimidine glycosylase [Salinisphaeraceae bacterium]